MTCASCAARVENKLDGATATVNFAPECAAYTAPSAFSRRHTAVRSRDGSLGTWYMNISHRTVSPMPLVWPTAGRARHQKPSN
jgi:hypothetical protein